MALNFPRAETATDYISMAFDPDLTKATTMAIQEMVDFIAVKWKMSKHQAYQLISVGGNVAVTQLVDKPNHGVHVVCRRAVHPAVAWATCARCSPSGRWRFCRSRAAVTRDGGPAAAEPVDHAQLVRLARRRHHGPSIMRVPSWLPHPLGKYYAYFGHHKGQFIRLAYADAIAGPWTIYEPGVVPVRDTAFYRPQPDPPGTQTEQFYTHVASPEIYVDEANKRLVLWAHGWWTDGKPWPGGLRRRALGARQRLRPVHAVERVHRRLHFERQSPITKVSYLRVFPHDRYLYGLARSVSCCDRRIARRVRDRTESVRRRPVRRSRRHVATLVRGRTLYVFFPGSATRPSACCCRRSISRGTGRHGGRRLRRSC